MVFAPTPTPTGYSYLEDAPCDYFNPKNGPSMNITALIQEAVLDEILKGRHARRATILVRKGVTGLYKTPTGKLLVDRVASVSLNKSVQGAAAISHVSKIMRSHGISSFGTMVFNDGKLLMRYCEGDINGTEFGKELFKETMGQSGDMMGWMIGASVAAILVCGPFGAAATAFAGSAIMVATAPLNVLKLGRTVGIRSRVLPFTLLRESGEQIMALLLEKGGDQIEITPDRLQVA
ncbi:hypothetical protein JX266_013877 [Neoarthrinium moseri]|nr:hypothetical protein JX266_013877 [Neoarthrinium moseri]